MPSKIRLQRISERIREELASMLLTQVQDPRLNGVFVNDVKVDRELAYADIYVSAVEGIERSKEVIEGLYSAQGFLRRALADKVELRTFPRLRFHWDPTPERADHIERVFAQMHEQDQQAQSENAPIDDEDMVDEVDEVDEEELLEDEGDAEKDNGD